MIINKTPPSPDDPRRVAWLPLLACEQNPRWQRSRHTERLSPPPPSSVEGLQFTGMAGAVEACQNVHSPHVKGNAFKIIINKATKSGLQSSLRLMVGVELKFPTYCRYLHALHTHTYTHTNRPGAADTDTATAMWEQQILTVQRPIPD